MINALVGLALAVVIVSPAGAGALKVGYGRLPVELNWVVIDLPNGVFKNEKESVAQNLLTMNAELTYEVADSLALGGSLGFGMPIGRIKFDNEREYSNTSSAGYNRNEGDSMSWEIMVLPVLVRASYSKEVGVGTIGLGLGTGIVLVNMHVVRGDWYYDDGSGTPQSDKTSPLDPGVCYLEWDDNELASLFELEFTPSFSMHITEKDSVGLEIPLALMGKTWVKKLKADTKSDSIGDPRDDNPLIGGAEVGPALELGGFSWGVNLVYTRKLGCETKEPQANANSTDNP